MTEPVLRYEFLPDPPVPCIHCGLMVTWDAGEGGFVDKPFSPLCSKSPTRFHEVPGD